MAVQRLAGAWQRLIIVVMSVAALVACAGSDPHLRRLAAAQMAIDAGWQRSNLEGGSFVLAAFAPAALGRVDVLTIYIEGDGMAWINAKTPSFDPTPREPLALRLSLLDPSGSAVYLGRPCQYVAGEDWRNCQQKYWTSHRFAPEVIAASDRAVSALKRRYGAKRLLLIGYSGGGAIAALLAAGRTDIDRLVTVAGNLDHSTWTARYRLSPLSGSLNPADSWRQLQELPQHHYVGSRDATVGENVVRAYAARFQSIDAVTISVVPDFDHQCCWTEIWPNLVNSGYGDTKTIPQTSFSRVNP